MEPLSPKLRHQVTTPVHGAETGSRVEPAGGRTFDSVEEMLQFDAAQHPPPSGVAERLHRSIREMPAPGPSWWRRLFGRR